ncbi:MAG: ABC transporter ATP-binding protein [bacterium]|nr:ABC transporter ATP-binding protein [bacterium]
MNLPLKNKGLVLGWHYLWKYKKSFKKVVYISFFGAVLGAIVPMIFGKLVQQAADPNISMWIFVGLVLVWAIADQIKNWSTRYTDKNGAFVAWDASADLFIDGMQHLVKLPMSYLGDQRLGKIVQRLDRSAEFLERDAREVVFSLLPHFATAILGIIFVFTIDWRLSLILVVVVVCYVLAMTSKTKNILSKTREVRRKWEDCWGYIWDIVNNTKAVKSNTNEGFEMKRIEKAYTLPYDKEKEIEEIRTQLKTREHLVFGLGAVIALACGTYLLRIRVIDAGSLIAFLFYLNLVYQPFSRLSHNWRLLQESMVALERTAKFLEIEEEDYEKGQSGEMIGRVEFRDVAFSYSLGGEASNRTVFEDMNFVIEPGETVALVGESGVGKTTLVDLISGYFSPSGGSIMIDGRDVREWNLKSLRSQIAIVPQDIYLFNDTIKLNIAYGDVRRFDDLEEIKEAAKAAYADEFISSAKFDRDYETVVGEKGVKMSTGQRQRVAIARAFLRNSIIRILILDEVTSALDSRSEQKIQESLNELKKGKTTFIIAHRLSTIMNADKIIVLDQGRVVQIGKHDHLLKQEGPYRQFVKLQNLQRAEAVAGIAEGN